MPFHARDAAGGRVSLLNDDPDQVVLPQYSDLSFRPRHSSTHSSNISSPIDEALTRHASWAPSNESSSPSSSASHSFYPSLHSSPRLPHQSMSHQQIVYTQSSPPPNYQYPPPPAPIGVQRDMPYGYPQHPVYHSSADSSPTLPQHHYPQSYSPPPNPRRNNAQQSARDAKEVGKGQGKRYPCHNGGCEKTFTTSGHASRHSKIHTQEKMISCTFEGCEKKFTRSDNMKQHMETHKRRRRSTENGVRKPAHNRTSSARPREPLYNSAGIDILADVALREPASEPKL